jgi:cell division septal protein FtsQ
VKRNSKLKLNGALVTLLPIAIFLFVIWLLIMGVKAYIDNASYFKIKKIVIHGLEDKKKAHSISESFLYDNIFSLNLNRIKEDLKLSNPQFYDLELLREFPDKLIINVIVRKPIAQLEHRGFFLVDKDGVIVSDRSGAPFKDKVVVLGLRAMPDLSFGKKINSEVLQSGLKLSQNVKYISRDLISLIPELSDEKIRIDISRHPSIIVYFDYLELRFYENNLKKGFESLRQVLSSLRNKIDQVKYIDLRFEEPAVSFKK